MPHTYKCRFSRTIRSLSIGIITIYVVVGISLLYIFFNMPQDKLTNLYSMIFIGLIGLCILILLAFRPLKIVYDPKNKLIRVVFLFHSIRFSTDEITDTYLVDRLPTLRAASQGVMGYLGITIDGTIIYVTDIRNMILIATRTKKYLLSCENSEDLALRISQEVPA